MLLDQWSLFDHPTDASSSARRRPPRLRPHRPVVRRTEVRFAVSLSGSGQIVASSLPAVTLDGTGAVSSRSPVATVAGSGRVSVGSSGQVRVVPSGGHCERAHTALSVARVSRHDDVLFAALLGD